MSAALHKRLFKFLTPLLFVLAFPAHAARIHGDYILMAGPEIVSGDDGGVGGVVGLTKSPEGDLGIWPGIFLGGYYRKNFVAHADLVAAFGLGFMDFVVGVGLRAGKATLASGQITYGLAIGPTTMALRRYQGREGFVTEGLITFNIPFFRFGGIQAP